MTRLDRFMLCFFILAVAVFSIAVLRAETITRNWMSLVVVAVFAIWVLLPEKTK